MFVLLQISDSFRVWFVRSIGRFVLGFVLFKRMTHLQQIRRVACVQRTAAYFLYIVLEQEIPQNWQKGA